MRRRSGPEQAPPASRGGPDESDPTGGGLRGGRRGAAVPHAEGAVGERHHGRGARGVSRPRSRLRRAQHRHRSDGRGGDPGRARVHPPLGPAVAGVAGPGTDLGGDRTADPGRVRGGERRGGSSDHGRTGGEPSRWTGRPVDLRRGLHVVRPAGAAADHGVRAVRTGAMGRPARPGRLGRRPRTDPRRSGRPRRRGGCCCGRRRRCPPGDGLRDPGRLHRRLPARLGVHGALRRGGERRDGRARGGRHPGHDPPTRRRPTHAGVGGGGAHLDRERRHVRVRTAVAGGRGHRRAGVRQRHRPQRPHPAGGAARRAPHRRDRRRQPRGTPPRCGRPRRGGHPVTRNTPPGAATRPGRVRPPDWFGYAATAVTGGLALAACRWTVTGSGYPFGPSDPLDAMSLIRGLPPGVGAPLFAGVLAVTAVAMLAMTASGGARRWGGARVGLLAVGWTAAAVLLAVVPDIRLLALTAYAPMLLVGAPFGWPDIDYGTILTASMAYQGGSLLGGLLVAATVLVWQRRTRGACARCGRTDATTPARWRPAAVGRWA